MALITCPDCGFEHSDAAPACPNCGRPKQRFKKLFEKPSRFINCQKSLLKDWRVKTTFAIILLAGAILLPRLAKYGLRIWDPFSITTWETSFLWYNDGGIRFTQTCRDWGYLGYSCSDNSKVVQKSCAALNEIQYNPRKVKLGGIVSNAIPQEKNVEGGSCVGTLYTIKRSNTISGWERLRYAYCESPLVKKVDGKHEDYLRVGNYFWFPPGNLCWQRAMN